ncbi:MAG TPA: hypothetical protein VFL85_05135 [Candidatus Saccharimonadales bacterium]|nr:hypothetical protein [Candidatus Saccharimonadales bacterium]
MSEQAPRTSDAYQPDQSSGKIDWKGFEDEYGRDQVEAIKLYMTHGTSAFRHGHSAEGLPPTADEIKNARPPR